MVVLGRYIGVVWDSCMVNTLGFILSGGEEPLDGFQQGCGMV